MVSVVQGDVCLANLLAIGEPRGVLARAGAASLLGVFSLGGAGLVAVYCADLCPRPLVGGRRPRSALDSQLTIAGRDKVQGC